MASQQKQVINKVKLMTHHKSNAKMYANKYKLDIVNVTWEDSARFKKYVHFLQSNQNYIISNNIIIICMSYNSSIWGPCISDMTLQVDNERMPVIREPNYSDKTWDVKIEKIPIVIGNQCLIDDDIKNDNNNGNNLQTISLKEYLCKFDKYMTKPMENIDINLLRKNNKDSHVIMSSQCCFLPIQKSKETKFNIALYNYQSRIKDPAVLVIVSTSRGTSAQIIEGHEQKLLFNNHGRKGIDLFPVCFVYILC